MAIKKIKEDLHKSNSKYTKRKHNKTVYNAYKFEEDVSQNSKATWQKIQDHLFETKIKAIVLGATILVVITIVLLSVTSFVYFQRTYFSQDNVKLSIIAPKTSDSNRLVNITFKYDNNNRASLHDAEIKVQFGKYFVPVSEQEHFHSAGLNSGVILIGDINSHSKKEITIAGHFVGPEGFVENIIGDLYYQPKKTSVIYSVQGKSTTAITSSPIVVDFESPKEVVGGSSLDLIITCHNTSRRPIDNIKLVIDYPNTFSFKSAEPYFAQDKTWFIDSLPSQGEQIMRLQGVLSGDVGTVQMFRAQVEAQASQDNIIYATHKYSPIIVSAPIVLSQHARNIKDNTVYAGNELNYTINFLNDSNLPIRDAILNVYLDSKVLNFEDLDLDDKGYYDSVNSLVTWKASDIPALKLLEPHESGQVHFTIPIMETLPIKSTADTNFVIETRASIDSEDIPSPIRNNKTILTNSLLIKVGTQVPFVVTGKYKDGELPPRVGKKTTYTLTIEVGSYNNDLKDVIVSAVLPTGVIWDGSISGDKKDSVSFNQRANSLSWNIGGVTHGEGLFLPSKQISFDVSITPSIDQVRSAPVLIKDINLKAVDLFTNTEVAVNHLNKTTILEEDKQVDDKEIVIE